MTKDISKRAAINVLVGVTAGAAAGVAAIDTAAALTTDPIFAVIEAHKRAYVAYAQAQPAYHELELRDYQKWLVESPQPDMPKIDNDHPIRLAFDRVLEPFVSANDALYATEPTTLAGAAALVCYVALDPNESDGLDFEHAQQVLETLARSLPKFAKA